MPLAPPAWSKKQKVEVRAKSKEKKLKLVKKKRERQRSGFFSPQMQKADTEWLEKGSPVPYVIRDLTKYPFFC